MAKKKEENKTTSSVSTQDAALKAKLRAMTTALSQIEKATQKEGMAYKLGDKPIQEIKRISTGSLPLDIALGGGMPCGRIIELYGAESSGKTLIATKTIAECQKNGGVCAIIDAEHAFDPIFAAKLGVDIENLYVAQPDHMTEAFTIMDKFVDAGCDLIVLDSTAALVPKEEFESDEVLKSSIGLIARGMSQFLRRITPKAANSGSTLIFINQTRDNVGVMYGCLHADTLVNFVDGRSIPIRKVVENKIEGEVWSYNEKTKQLEPKPIIDWHYNGNVNDNNDYIHFETQHIALGTIHSNGKNGFTVTPNHEILTQDGWKQAKNVKITDKLVSRYNSFINETLADFIYGTIIGDCSVSIRKKETACLKFQDNENAEYVNWKLNKLSSFFNFIEVKYNNKLRYDSDYSYELAKIKKEMNSYSSVRNPLIMLENHYSDLGLALWYMDDGYLDKDRQNRVTIATKRLKNDKKSLNKIIDLFKEKVGIDVVIRNNGCIAINSKDIDIFMQKIYKYVPECMQYKLPEEYRGKYEDFNLTNHNTVVTDFVSINMIRPASNRQIRQKGKYDLTILDNSNYMVGSVENGVIVHNSPETTPGGKALKFYSSVRIKVSRNNNLDTKGSNGDIEQRGLKCNVVKNKTAIPYRTAEFSVYLDGQEATKDITVDIANISMSLGYIMRCNKDGEPKATGRYWKASTTYKDEQGNEQVDEMFVMGKDNCVAELANHPHLKDYLLAIIKGEIEKPEMPQVEEKEMTEEELQAEIEADLIDELAEDDAEETETVFKDL